MSLFVSQLNDRWSWWWTHRIKLIVVQLLMGFIAFSVVPKFWTPIRVAVIAVSWFTLSTIVLLLWVGDKPTDE